MKSPSKKMRAEVRPAVQIDRPGEFLRAWLLLALVALCVARPLLPSEGVSWLGDGQPFNMLWIVVAAGYCLWAIARGGLARRLDLIDGAVAALVVTCVVSALAGGTNRVDDLELGLTGVGSRRLTLNMLFEWVSLGLAFFLTRQLVRTARESRAVVAVMVALAVVLAGYGFYQVLVSLPASRAEYAADPDAALEMMDQWYPAGSPERMRFESRLQSTEPLATFALTNSLAGYLAPWLILGLGIAWNLAEIRGVARWADAEKWTGAGAARIAALAVCLLAVAGCFVLTKSRTGYVALATGVVLLPFFSGAGRRMLDWKFVLACAVALVLATGAALALRGIDAALVTEAYKSLGYRLEYWRSTLAMIRSHPWLGVGPGNFQDYYTQFKLPEASEEVRDPHNFVLEVWATAGTFALVALGTALGAFGFRVWNVVAASSRPAESSSPAESMRNATFIAAGAAAGVALAFLIGPSVGFVFPEGQLAGGLVVGAAVLAILWPWIQRGTLAPRLPALGVLVLAIHLLASGGITFPGVADSFWVLLALGLNQVESETAAGVSGGRTWVARLAPLGALVVVCAVGACCFVFAYRPVLACRAAMSQAQELRDPTARLKGFLRAAKADSLAFEPWGAIAEFELDRWKQHPVNGPSLQQFASATEQISRLRPHSSAAWRQIGAWYMEVYEHNHDSEAASTAADCYRNAVELYPNSATLRGDYALALSAAGDAGGARRHAGQALELDELTPHADKKLSAVVRRQLAQLAATPR